MAFKIEKIRGEVKKALRREYSFVRKELDPLMKDIDWGDISPRWWIKREGDKSCMGKCFRGSWGVRTRSETGRITRRNFRNLILLDKNYYENNGLEDTLGVFRHELIHLVARDGHGSHFKTLARACGAKRNCPSHKKK